MTGHVFLVPGFFGFANLGGLTYFHHVEGVLKETFSAHGRALRVHHVDTLPTASISRRATRLLELISEVVADDDLPIHLIGHSTGAVDIRVMLNPVRETPMTAKLLTRVVSAVSVAGAHRGTPLASSFKSAFGKQLLALTSLLTLRALRLGELPLSMITSMTAALGHFDKAVAAKPDLLDQLQETLLDDLTPERREVLRRLFDDVLKDQGLLDELEPNFAMHTDAQTEDRPGVRYACVVTAAKPPDMLSSLRAGLSPYAQFSHALYHVLWRLARAPASTPMPVEATLQEARVADALGFALTPACNDGIVPSCSQFHGPMLRAVCADHHDVLGHFDDERHVPAHVDWMHSGSAFGRSAFEALWADIAAFILDAERLSFLPR